MRYEKKLQMTLTGDRVYVLVTVVAGSVVSWRVVLPGDMMDITDQLTWLERDKVKRKVARCAF